MINGGWWRTLETLSNTQLIRACQCGARRWFRAIVDAKWGWTLEHHCLFCGLSDLWLYSRGDTLLLPDTSPAVADLPDFLAVLQQMGPEGQRLAAQPRSGPGSPRGYRKLHRRSGESLASSNY